jgi:hypothetical protein
MSTCRHCGLEEREHHRFEPMTGPEGCVCFDDGSWGYDPIAITPICAQYESSRGTYGNCVTCEHDKACHAARSGAGAERGDEGGAARSGCTRQGGRPIVSDEKRRDEETPWGELLRLRAEVEQLKAQLAEERGGVSKADLCKALETYEQQVQGLESKLSERDREIERLRLARQQALIERDRYSQMYQDVCEDDEKLRQQLEAAQARAKQLERELAFEEKAFAIVYAPLNCHDIPEELIELRRKQDAGGQP